MRAQLIKRSEDYVMMNVIFVRNKWDEETEVVQLLDSHHHVEDVGVWYDITTAPIFHKFKDENGKLCKEVMLFLIKAEVANV